MGETRIIRIALFIIMAVVLLFPSWLMIANSFSPARAFLRKPPRLLPYEWTIKNYVKAFTLPLLPRWIGNTLIIVSAIIIGGTLLNGAAGYAFCYSRTKLLRVLFWLFMAPIFVTRFVLLISQIWIIGKLHLSGLVAVILFSLFWPTGIYLFRNYFRAIPISILEGARIDGATEWTILMQIVLPLSKPILGVAVVFLGMGALGDYVFQMLNLQRPETQTYLVGLMTTTLNVLIVKNIGYDLTVGTLLFLPYLLLFAFSSKYFIGGLTGGALKE